MKKYFWKAFLLLTTLCAAMSCEMLEEMFQTDPTVFEASLVEQQINASQTEVTAKVICDVKWTATLEDSSWGSIAQTIVSENTGIIVLDLGFNEGKEKRSNTLSIKAGSKTLSISIDQEGIGSLIDPVAVKLRGKNPSEVSFLPGLSWKLTTDTAWIELPERTSGLAGADVKLSIKANEEFIDVGSREGSLTLTFDNKYKVAVPVTQYQTDAVILEQSQLEADCKAQTLSLRVDSNTDYTVSTTASWVHPQASVPTKALNVSEEFFDIDANPTSNPRTAQVTFTGGEDGKATAMLTIVQEGHDPIIDITTCGLYGIGGTDYTIQPNVMQTSSIISAASATYTYQIILFNNFTIVKVTGLPLVQEDGTNCTLGLNITRAGETLLDRSADCNLVGQSNNLRWYRVVGGNEYFIIDNVIK